MAVNKKETKAKKTTTKKAAPAKKAPPAKKAIGKEKKGQVGSVYECKVCGLAVEVIDDCGCVAVCDLICCEEAMKPKKTKAA